MIKNFAKFYLWIVLLYVCKAWTIDWTVIEEVRSSENVDLENNSSTELKTNLTCYIK